MKRLDDFAVIQKIAGRDVSFIQIGQGEDLVMLHGYLSSKEAFATQIAYFSKFYKVTAIDFLGFGNSGRLDAAFSVGDYAAFTKEVFKALGIKRAKVIAHSFGCRVAIKMAKEDTQVFDEIVLTGPAGVVMPRSVGYKIKVAGYRLVKKFAPRFAEKHFGSKEYRTLSSIMKESYKKIVNEDLRSDARRIKNRVLIVQGASDTTTPMREAEAYLQCFENGKLKVIDGGHFAFCENSTTFNLTVEEFFCYG